MAGQTKAELLEQVEALGIEIPDGFTKADLTELLETYEAPTAPEVARPHTDFGRLNSIAAQRRQRW